MKRYYPLLLVFVLNSCITQNFIPPRPLEKGDHELRVGFNYSFNKMSFNSIQLSFFYGIDTKNVIGTSFNNFIIPNNISYGHYWNDHKSSHNIQIHINDLISSSFNPNYELDYGYSYNSLDFSHLFKLGVGYFSTPLLHKIAGNYYSKNEFIPIAGYRISTDIYYFDFQYLHGMTKFFIDYYKNDLLIRPAIVKSEESGTLEYVELQYSHSSIDTIICSKNKYMFVFDIGDTLILDDEDPYADCIGCGVEQNLHAAYPASENHKIYWLYWHQQSTLNSNKAARMIELDMDKVLSEYYLGNDLSFVEDDSLALKSYLKSKTFLNDLIISIGLLASDN